MKKYPTPFTPEQAVYEKTYQASGNYPLPRNLERPVKTSEWLGMILIAILPLINIFAAIIWSFSSKHRKSKRNFAQALLLLVVIVVNLLAAGIVVVYMVLDTTLLELAEKFIAGELI